MGRQFDIWDLVANGLGIFAGWALSILLPSKSELQIEDRMFFKQENWLSERVWLEEVFGSRNKKYGVNSEALDPGRLL
ncbi:MAG: hypothetical protein U0T81_18230 [Saprospiraceae bacterium]